jgi:hypothetical protein
MPLICGQEINYICQPCKTIERGRIRGVAYLRVTVPAFDYSNPALWAAQVSANNAFIIPFVKGTSDGGPVTEVDGYGDIPTYITGRMYTINYMDPSIVENCAFYRRIEKSPEWRFAFVTESRLWISTRAVSVYAINPIEMDPKTAVEHNVTVKFTESDLLCSFERPTGTFETCPGT